MEEKSAEFMQILWCSVWQSIMVFSPGVLGLNGPDI
jgi:hypothetical protein